MLELLKNGSSEDVSPVMMIDGNSYFIVETCAFDSLFEIFCVAYMSFLEVRDFVDSNSSSSIFFSDGSGSCF